MKICKLHDYPYQPQASLKIVSLTLFLSLFKEFHLPHNQCPKVTFPCLTNR